MSHPGKFPVFDTTTLQSSPDPLSMDIVRTTSRSSTTGTHKRGLSEGTRKSANPPKGTKASKGTSSMRTITSAGSPVLAPSGNPDDSDSSDEEDDEDNNNDDNNDEDDDISSEQNLLLAMIKDTITDAITKATEPLIKENRKLRNKVTSMNDKLTRQGDKLATIQEYVDTITNNLHEATQDIRNFHAFAKATTAPTKGKAPAAPASQKTTTAPSSQAPATGTQASSWATVGRKGATKAVYNIQTEKTGPKKPQPSQTAENYITKADRRFTITRNTTDIAAEIKRFDAAKARNLINNTLTKQNAPSHLKVALCSMNARGNITVLCKDDCKATDIFKYRKAITTDLRAADQSVKDIHISESWTKVLIHGVDLRTFPDNDDGMDAMKSEIETYNSRVRVMIPVRYATSPEKRTGKTHSSVVVAVQDKEAAEYILKHGVYINGRALKTREYDSCRPYDQCTTCQDFGHHLSRCKKTDQPTCRLCAGEHATSAHSCSRCPNRRGRACPHIALKCSHCRGPHRATDSECPVVKEIHLKYQVQFPGRSNTVPATQQNTDTQATNTAETDDTELNEDMQDA